jgi:hypothetical protein
VQIESRPWGVEHAFEGGRIVVHEGVVKVALVAGKDVAKMVRPVVKAGKVLPPDLRFDVARARGKDHNGQDTIEEKAHVSKVRHHNVAMPQI